MKSPPPFSVLMNACVEITTLTPLECLRVWIASVCGDGTCEMCTDAPGPAVDYEV